MSNRAEPAVYTLSRSVSFRLSGRSSSTTSDKFVSKVYFNPKLTKAIHPLPRKAHVDLSFWCLIDDDMPLILNKIINEKQCSSLDLCGNKLTCKSIKTLTLNPLKNEHLEKIDFSFNQLIDIGARTLSDLILTNRYSVLRRLMLNKNGISNTGAKYLAEMLKNNRTIEELWLSDNEIGNQGVESLVDALSNNNRTLKVLILSFNTFITNRSVEYFVKLMKTNQTLQNLSIHHCNLPFSTQTLLAECAITKKNFRLEI